MDSSRVRPGIERPAPALDIAAAQSFREPIPLIIPKHIDPVIRPWHDAEGSGFSTGRAGVQPFHERETFMTTRQVRSAILLSASLALGCSTAAASDNFVFLTSTTGTADLSTWPESGGQIGLAAGDAICQTRADAAGLPGIYAAYLSDGTDDAYCRIQGLAGRRFDDCGLGAPPAPGDSNPWFRPDSRPVFPDAVEMHFPESETMYYPLWLDESGMRQSGAVITGSNEFGTAANTCSGFTSESGSVSAGFPELTSSNWGSGFGLGCGTGGRLACFRVDTEPAEIVPDSPGIRQAFISPARVFGAMQDNVEADGIAGVAGGDRVCRNLAAQAGLYDSGSFKAFLSAGSTPAWNRFDHPDLPWARIDGVRFADDLASLRDGAGALTALNRASDGSFITRQQAWSGTLFDGTVSSDTCGGWATSTGSGETGQANLAGTSWAESNPGTGLPCELRIAHLFCLSDSDLVFRDDWDA